MIRRRLASLLLFLALPLLAASAPGLILCVGGSGHQELETAQTSCCRGSDLARSTSSAWSLTEACGPCTDFPLAGSALRSEEIRPRGLAGEALLAATSPSVRQAPPAGDGARPRAARPGAAPRRSISVLRV